MKRLWGIRHLRYYWLRMRIWQWARWWGEHGIGLGFPNEADLRQLDRIWEGKA
jgi:hypothetical protein